MRILYNLVFFLFGIFYLPYLIVTKRYRYGMRERFGILPDRIKEIASKEKVIWAHAVSVGEIKVAAILAPFLRKAFPWHILLFSTVTNTGYKIAKTVATGREGVFFLPFDISFIVDKVVRIIRPEIFISFETELWPNLIYSLSKSGAKAILVNGRISDRSYPRYRKSRFLTKAILSKFSLILMQSDQDADRIIDLGAPGEKVFVTGNLKFDLMLSGPEDKRIEARAMLGLNKDEILIIAGSTHRGEEEIIVDCFAGLKKQYPDARLLIAPRHIERAEEIEKLLLKNNLKSMRISIFSEIASSSATKGGGTPRNDRAFNASALEPIFILDTIGELKSMYSAGDIVFIGKSLVNKGGQNPIEPAIFAKPIIFGKYMFNFQDAVKILLKNDAAIEVGGKEQLYSALKFLLDNPAERTRIGFNAKETTAKNSGSSQRAINLIVSHIS